MKKYSVWVDQKCNLKLVYHPVDMSRKIITHLLKKFNNKTYIYLGKF